MSWSKKDRIDAVLNGEVADRAPVTAYRHFPGMELDPALHAKSMLDFQAKYDWDWMKINPSAVYYYEPWGNKYDYNNYNASAVPTKLSWAVQGVSDLKKIVAFTGDYDAFGRQLAGLRLIKEGAPEDLPIFQSVFSPIAILLNLCGDRSPGRYREAPRDNCVLLPLFRNHKELVHQALKNITLTLADYVAKCMAIGIDGIFFAEMGLAREGYLTFAEWQEFVMPYDLQVLEAVGKGYKLLHTCGIYGNPERFAKYYPLNGLHWAESAPGNPPITGSEKWLGKMAALGGVDERLFGTNSADKIAAMASRSVEENRHRPFMLTPECTVSINTTDEEYTALRNASK